MIISFMNVWDVNVLSGTKLTINIVYSSIKDQVYSTYNVAFSEKFMLVCGQVCVFASDSCRSWHSNEVPAEAVSSWPRMHQGCFREPQRLSLRFLLTVTVINIVFWMWLCADCRVILSYFAEQPCTRLCTTKKGHVMHFYHFRISLRST